MTTIRTWDIDPDHKPRLIEDIRDATRASSGNCHAIALDRRPDPASVERMDIYTLVLVGHADIPVATFTTAPSWRGKAKALEWASRWIEDSGLAAGPPHA